MHSRLTALALALAVASCAKTEPGVAPIPAAIPNPRAALPPLPADESEKQFQAQGQAAVNAETAKDWDKLVGLTIPKAIELAGGPGEFAKKVAAQSANPVVESRCGPVQASAEANGVRYAVAPAPVAMTIADSKQHLIAARFLLGASHDGGRTWKFISVGGPQDTNRAAVKAVLPDLPDALELPKGTPTVTR